MAVGVTLANPVYIFLAGHSVANNDETRRSPSIMSACAWLVWICFTVVYVDRGLDGSILP